MARNPNPDQTAVIQLPGLPQGLALGLAGALIWGPGSQALSAEAGHHNRPATLLANVSLLRLMIHGSLIGLGIAVVALVLIWWHEWRHGQNW
jgi:hypothetical protein